MQALPNELKYHIAQHIHAGDDHLYFCRREKHQTSLFPLLGLSVEWRSVALSLLFSSITIDEIPNKQLEEIIDSHQDAFKSTRDVNCSFHPIVYQPASEPISDEELFGKWNEVVEGSEESTLARPQDREQGIAAWMAERVGLLARIVDLTTTNEHVSGVQRLALCFGRFQPNLEPLVASVKKLNLELVQFTHNPPPSINALNAVMHPTQLNFTWFTNYTNGSPNFDSILFHNPRLLTLLFMNPSAMDYTWLCKSPNAWTCPLTRLFFYGEFDCALLLHVVQQCEKTIRGIRLPDRLSSVQNGEQFPSLKLDEIVLPWDTAQNYFSMFAHITVTKLNTFHTSLDPIWRLVECPYWFKSTRHIILAVRMEEKPEIGDLLVALAKRNMTVTLRWHCKLEDFLYYSLYD